LAIYAYWGSTPEVELHIYSLLEELRSMNFEICFVSNSPLSANSQAKLSAFCKKCIQRENIGLDFSMWKTGLAEYDVTQLDELLLINSSIIGPLKPLAPLWKNPSVAGCDFWGLTDNWDPDYHLLSFFFVFTPKVLQHPCFLEFWRSVLPYRNKEQIIRSYEYGLSQWLLESGFKPGVIYAQKDIFAAYFKRRSFLRRIKDLRYRYDVPGMNISLAFAEDLLQRGMPFLKASLLRPDEIHYVTSYENVFRILKASSLPAAAIEELRIKASSFPARKREKLFVMAYLWIRGTAARFARAWKLVR
jgi:hypothetical protein